MDKKKWESPVTVMQEFRANEYVAACYTCLGADNNGQTYELKDGRTQGKNKHKHTSDSNIIFTETDPVSGWILQGKKVSEEGYFVIDSNNVIHYIGNTNKANAS